MDARHLQKNSINPNLIQKVFICTETARDKMLTGSKLAGLLFAFREKGCEDFVLLLEKSNDVKGVKDKARSEWILQNADILKAFSCDYIKLEVERDTLAWKKAYAALTVLFNGSFGDYKKLFTSAAAFAKRKEIYADRNNKSLDEITDECLIKEFENNGRIARTDFLPKQIDAWKKKQRNPSLVADGDIKIHIIETLADILVDDNKDKWQLIYEGSLADQLKLLKDCAWLLGFDNFDVQHIQIAFNADTVKLSADDKVFAKKAESKEALRSSHESKTEKNKSPEDVNLSASSSSHSSSPNSQRRANTKARSHSSPDRNDYPATQQAQTYLPPSTDDNIKREKKELLGMVLNSKLAELMFNNAKGDYRSLGEGISTVVEELAVGFVAAPSSRPSSTDNSPKNGSPTRRSPVPSFTGELPGVPTDKRDDSPSRTRLESPKSDGVPDGQEPVQFVSSQELSDEKSNSSGDSGKENSDGSVYSVSAPASSSPLVLAQLAKTAAVSQSPYSMFPRTTPKSSPNSSINNNMTPRSVSPAPQSDADSNDIETQHNSLFKHSRRSSAEGSLQTTGKKEQASPASSVKNII